MAERAQKALKSAAGKTGSKGGGGSGGGGGGTRGKKPAGGAPKPNEGDKREESLQAVILADSFETRFSPFTLEKPRCLLPLANTPLIEYTLEFLAMSGVQDIYIYCGSQASEVEKYLRSSRWDPSTSPASPFQTLDLIKTTSRSVGDAMRDLDARSLITGDFLLVHGDMVSNLPIDGALARHRSRRAADKNAIMTIVLRDGGLGHHRIKPKAIKPVFVIDPTKQRCLHYEEITPLQSNKYVNIDPDIISEHSEMEIRTDLIDCEIDICTPDVLALWAESFDYEIPRKHFLHGVLKDYELNGKTIHTEIVSDHYAARVSNLQAYESVSKDILGRWTYPLVPDSNLMADHSYRFERGGVCKEQGVILARGCKVGKNTVLGKETSIGDGSVVINSIIGRRCKIGKNVNLQNAYIWDDVAIGDGARIHRAIIANEAVVGQKCVVNPGALLSFGVRIENGKEIKEGARITCAKRRRQDETNDEEPITVPSDTVLVGSSGSGYDFYDSEEDEDDEVALQSSLIYSTDHLNLSTESISTLASDISDQADRHDRSRLNSFAGSMLSDDDMSSSGALGNSTNTGEAFHHDAVADVLRTLSEAGDFHNLRVEFTSLRLSNNATDHQMRRAIAVAFTKRVVQLVEAGSEATRAVARALDQEGAQPFINEVGIGSKKKVADQVDFLACLQKDLAGRAAGDVALAAMCQGLYEREVVEEEAFEEWWGEDGAGEGETKKIRGKTEIFINWLREAEEEDSDDEEDESD